MAEDLISSIFDEPAIKKQIADTNAQLDNLALKLKNFPTINLGGSATTLKELTLQNKAYESSLKSISLTQKGVSDAEKTAASESKRIATEKTQQAKLAAAELRLQQIEIKKNQIAETESANASKLAAAEQVAAGRERILQLKAEQQALEQAAEAEKQRNAAEQGALAGTFNPGTIPGANRSSSVAIPLTIDQGNIVLVKQYENAIAKLTAEQKLAKDAFTGGKISQADYQRQIATSTQTISTYKNNISGLNKEIQLSAAVNNAERNSLERAQALIAQYTNEKKKLNLATSDGVLQNSNYNKAIQKSSEFILKNADAETVRIKSVGQYTQGIQKAFSGLRTLANILPGIGLGGLFLAGFEALKYLVEELGIFNSKLFTTAKQRELLLEVNTKAAESAGKEAGSLKILRAEIESTEVPMATRLQAIKNLKEEYPDYFKGLTNEQLLTGQVGDAYNLAAAAILRKARANAAAAKIEENSSKQLAIELKNQQDFITANEKFKNAQAQTRVVSGGSAGFGGGTDISVDKAGVRREIERGFKERKKLRDDERIEIQKENDFLIKFVLEGAKETVKIAKSRRDSKESTTEIFNAEFEETKRALQRRIKLLDENVNDESKTYDERIAALQEFIDTTDRLNRFQFQKDLEAEQEKLAIQQKNAGKAKGTDKKNIEKEIFNTQQRIKDLENKLYNQRLDLQDVFDKKKLEVTRSTNAIEDKIAKEHYEKQLKDAENANITTKSALDRQYEDDLQALNKRFVSGKLTQKQFNNDKQKLEFDYHTQSIRNELAYAKTILEIQKAAGIDTTKQQEAVANLANNLEKIIGDANVIQNEKDLANDKAYADKKKELYKQLYQEIQQTIFQFLNDGLKREEQDLDERKRLLDEDAQRRINNINQLGLTEVERVKQTSAIEKQAQFETEQIEKRKRAIAVQRAKFEKAANIATIIENTAAAITGALAQAKILGIGALPLSLLYGAIGAAQLARAISTPLPKYFTGTDSAKSGHGIYGELGRELVIPQSGKAYLSPAVATLTSFIGGEKIIPADLTASILNSTGMHRLAGMDITKPVTVDSVNNHLMGKMLGELKDLNRKSRIVIHNTSNIKTTAWYQQNFKN